MIMGALFQMWNVLNVLVFLTSIYHACTLSMHGSFFALCITFSFVQIEAWAIHHNQLTTAMPEVMPVFIVLVLTYQQQSQYIITWVTIFATFILTCDLLDILMMHDLHKCSVNSPVYYQLGLTLVSFFNFSLYLLLLSILFITHFVFFI
jgi:hypothetical protein